MSIEQSFPNLFKDLGTLAEESEDYTIKLKPSAVPHALHTARGVPIPLRKKVEEKLFRMQNMDVILPVDDPSPWCAGIVVVPKPSDSVRICVDLARLIQNVFIEYHLLPKVDNTLAQLTVAKKFAKLNVNSGFWQIPLTKTSQLLMTFITPVGRFCFNRLPFGISYAPELFQKCMNTMVVGLQGILCLMDDVLVYGQDQEEHDQRSEAVLQRMQAAGVMLNPDKCEFSKDQLKFLGRIIDKEGVRADPAKVQAILDLPPPSNVSQMHQFAAVVKVCCKLCLCYSPSNRAT